MVGFERALYTVGEGETASICVTIIRPPNIGSAVVYLQVIGNFIVPSGATEASKLASF